MSHTRIVLSQEPVYSKLPFTATHDTGPLCPRKVCPISFVYNQQHTDDISTSKLTSLASPPLSPVNIRGSRFPLITLDSTQKVRILEGKMIGFPFLFPDFKRRLSTFSRDAVVWKKWPGSFETLIDEEICDQPSGTAS
jgi:hypothetical protein